MFELLDYINKCGKYQVCGEWMFCMSGIEERYPKNVCTNAPFTFWWYFSSGVLDEDIYEELPTDFVQTQHQVRIDSPTARRMLTSTIKKKHWRIKRNDKMPLLSSTCSCRMRTACKAKQSTTWSTAPQGWHKSFVIPCELFALIFHCLTEILHRENIIYSVLFVFLSAIWRKQQNLLGLEGLGLCDMVQHKRPDCFPAHILHSRHTTANTKRRLPNAEVWPAKSFQNV